MYSYEKDVFYTTETGGGVIPPFYFVVGHDFAIDYTQWHHMKFIKDDLLNTLYFDDHLIFEVTIPVSLTGGHFALGAGMNGVYQIDNLVIKTDHPVPEPSTILLLASGLVGLAALRRRFCR